jgi:hypothetical protein
MFGWAAMKLSVFECAVRRNAMGPMLLQVEEDLAIARNRHLNQLEPHSWGSR